MVPPALLPWVTDLTLGELGTPCVHVTLGPDLCLSEKVQSTPFLRHDWHGLSLPNGAEHMICGGKKGRKLMGH